LIQDWISLTGSVEDVGRISSILIIRIWRKCPFIL